MTGITNATEHIVHTLTLVSSQDDEAGDCTELGRWFARFTGPFNAADIKYPYRAGDGCEYELPLSEYRDLRTMAGCIYRVDDQGFCDVTIYRDTESLNNAWDAVQEWETEAYGPQDDDITTEDGNTFYQSGKLVVDATNDDSPWPALESYMETEQYWPNVWSISDHGNAHIMTRKDQ
jgi:hypothetical protein